MRQKIPFILIILTVLAIWMQSILPGDASSAESSKVLELLLPLWNGSGLGGLLPLDEHLVRKVFGHFLEYFVLGMEVSFWAQSRVKQGAFNGPRLPLFSRLTFFPTLAAFGLIVAGIDETIQIFSQDRGPSLSDVGLDFCGFLSGMLILSVARSILGTHSIPVQNPKNMV